MKLTVFEKHQKKIAEATLRMSDAMINIMGGMTKQEAQEFLDKLHRRELEDKSEKI